MHDFVFGARSYLCRSAHLVTCCHIKVMMYVQVHYYIANSTMGWSQGQKERERVTEVRFKYHYVMCGTYRKMY